MTNNINADTNTKETLENNTKQEPKLYAGKYKTTEDLEKGYKELSTLVRVKTQKAPEVYDFSNVMDIDTENPLLGKMKDVMKSQNLTQDQATALTEAFVGYNNEVMPNPEDEIKKLGSDAPIIMQQVEGFMKRYLNNEETELLSQVAYSADGIKLLHKLSKYVGEKSIPANSSNIDMVGNLRKQANSMLEDKDLRNNPDKQEEYDAIWQKIVRLEN